MGIALFHKTFFKTSLWLVLVVLPNKAISNTSKVEHLSLDSAYKKALSFYPELSIVKIEVKYGRIRTSMAALPRVSSLLFQKKNKRSYTIIVNKKENKDPGRVVHSAPFDAQVGIFGHELAHILDYSEKSNCKMVGFAISYLGKEKRRITEQLTDSLTIVHGLGRELYHFSNYLFNEANIHPKYRKYKTKYYMHPQVLFLMVKRIEEQMNVSY